MYRKYNGSLPISFFFLFFSFVSSTSSLASGGYDNGTPAGQGKLDIDFTLDPGLRTRGAQSYVVWGYGLTDNTDFHGYLSHESATGVDQVYAGFMYNLISNHHLDLSTAAGVRQRLDKADLLFPQVLYTAKLEHGFDVIGSLVNVHSVETMASRGVTFDIALRVPVPQEHVPSGLRDIKLSFGAFRGVSRKWGPTYSIDCRF